MKSAKLLLLVSFCAPAVSSVFAHTSLTSAVPADGAVMHEAPQALALGFTEDAQLLKLELVDAAGQTIDIAFTPSGDARKTFNVPLPALKAAGYKVNWTVLGKDGHKVEGSLQFTVDPNAEATPGAAQSHDAHGAHH